MTSIDCSLVVVAAGKHVLKIMNSAHEISPASWTLVVVNVPLAISTGEVAVSTLKNSSLSCEGNHTNRTIHGSFALSKAGKQFLGVNAARRSQELEAYFQQLFRHVVAWWSRSASIGLVPATSSATRLYSTWHRVEHETANRAMPCV